MDETIVSSPLLNLARQLRVTAGGQGLPKQVDVSVIRGLVLDVDGTLTDGRLHYGPNGEELKVFNVHDGAGLTLWRHADLKLAIVTSRRSNALTQRTADLGIPACLVHQGVKHKLKVWDQICEALEAKPHQLAYMGDDIPDLPLLEQAGIACCPGNAVPEVVAASNLRAVPNGGEGAVRVVIEWLLQARTDGAWKRALDGMLGSSATQEESTITHVS